MVDPPPGQKRHRADMPCFSVVPGAVWRFQDTLWRVPNPLVLTPCQKNPRVRKILVRNSGAGNGCDNCMDTWKKCVLSAGKTHVHKIPPFRGGGGIWFFWGGGSADFIFMGAGIFLTLVAERAP